MSAASTVSNNRLDRVERILAISGATWLAFALYYLLARRFDSSSVCIGEAIMSCVLIWFARFSNRRFVVNVYLSSVMVGLLTETYLTGLSASYTPTFFCVVVLLAAYQLGPRAAWTWAAISLTSLLLIHFGLPDATRMPSPTQADRIIGQVGVLFFVLIFSVLAETSAEDYVEKLQAASEELREGSRKLNELVGTDTLTCLPNRHQFQRDIGQAIERATRNRADFGLLLIDLNGFKQINDRLGHAAGDRVLQDVARRLQEAVGAGAKIARLGGDEFTVIIENLRDEFAVSLMGGRVVRSISREYRLDGREMKLGSSVGAAVFPRDGSTVDDLLCHADAAMYEAKSNKSGVQLYEPSLMEESRRRQEVEDRLQRAVERDEFALFYQPQVEVRSGRIVGMEALIRWERDGQFVSPAEFISHLEDSGRIIEVGRWVLEQACHQARCWGRRGADVRISVNVSSVQFSQCSFVEDVWNAIESSGIDPCWLDLELTESVFLNQPSEAIHNIEMLREAGVSVSIDDFGTGYSSLSYLKALPINRLKIDRSFVCDIPNDDDGMIAETIIQLSHALGMSVVAEGVNSEAQLRFLQCRGCDEYQGFLFSRPVDAKKSYEVLGIDQTPSEPIRIPLMAD